MSVPTKILEKLNTMRDAENRKRKHGWWETLPTRSDHARWELDRNAEKRAEGKEKGKAKLKEIREAEKLEAQKEKERLSYLMTKKPVRAIKLDLRNAKFRQVKARVSSYQFKRIQLCGWFARMIEMPDGLVDYEVQLFRNENIPDANSEWFLVGLC